MSRHDYVTIYDHGPVGDVWCLTCDVRVTRLDVEALTCDTGTLRAFVRSIARIHEGAAFDPGDAHTLRASTGSWYDDTYVPRSMVDSFFIATKADG